jgi:hypothetical protein
VKSSDATVARSIGGRQQTGLPSAALAVPSPRSIC